MKTKRSFYNIVFLITFVAFLTIFGTSRSLIEAKIFGGGGSDVYLIKTDALGNELWSKTLGGSYHEYGVMAQQTTDGGYIMVSGNELIKTDSDGNEQWRKSFAEISSLASVIQTTDEGYILAATGWCDYCYYMGSAGTADCGLIKTDANGSLQWDVIHNGGPC